MNKRNYLRVLVQEDMERTLERLDTEEDKGVRSMLIDHAIALSDLDTECAIMWRQYRPCS